MEWVERFADNDYSTIREMLNCRHVQRADSFSLYGAGIFPPGMAEDYSHAHSMQYAMQFPRIPAWLGKNPPQVTLFMSNGDIVTYGELGLNYIADPEASPHMAMYNLPKGLNWYRYSAEGELLDQYAAMKNNHMPAWREMYAPGQYDKAVEFLLETREKHEAEITMTFSHGYHAVLESSAFQPYYIPGSEDEETDQPQIFAVWDLFGNDVDPDQPIEPLNSHTAMRTSRDQIAKNYALQIEAGLVDPAAVSPFAGLPNGPVVVDAVPRERPLQAECSGKGYIDVRPLDDPENPYRGRYEAWDYWLMDYVNAENPKVQEYFNQQAAEYSRKVNEYRQAGKPVPKDLVLDPSFRQSPDDPWHTYSISVDDNGCIIPQRERWKGRIERSTAPWDMRERPEYLGRQYYSLHSGGIMDEAMKADMVRAEWTMKAAYYPPVPAWLAENPVQMAVFIPNGDILTLGPLGWLPENANELSKEELWEIAEPGWYRYNATGELVDRYMTKDYDWERLYHDDRAWIITDAESRGLTAISRCGYLIINHPEDGGIEAIYDYDGHQCDPAQPLYRTPNYCVPVRWFTIENLHNCQNPEQPVSGEAAETEPVT